MTTYYECVNKEKIPKMENISASQRWLNGASDDVQMYDFGFRIFEKSMILDVK